MKKQCERATEELSKLVKERERWRTQWDEDRAGLERERAELARSIKVGQMLLL